MYFDNQAQDWDNDPKKVERATIFAQEINEFIKPNQQMDALEFGCGTGLLSFQLKDYFKSITLADNSPGMIEVLREKIKQSGIKKFKPLLIDDNHQLAKNDEFDVIYTLMTLHHIVDLDNILNTFHNQLKKDGYLCIADLVEEDGSFHAHHEVYEGHNGFDKDKLSLILAQNGFDVKFFKICFTIEKKKENIIKNYPLFLMICQKN